MNCGQAYVKLPSFSLLSLPAWVALFPNVYGYVFVAQVLRPTLDFPFDAAIAAC